MQTQQFQQPEPPKKGNTFKEILRELVRTKSFWIFIIVAILGTIATLLPFFLVVIATLIVPILGVVIGVLTILGVSIQGAETVLSQREIEQKHALVLQEIEHARGEAAQQYKQEMQEIKQARDEAAEQYADAIQKIEKARDEAHAENILLEAEKFATNLIEKDKLAKEAVELNPDIKQRVYRQLGVEMSAAVVDGFDRIKQMYFKASGSHAYFLVKLEPNEISFFTTTAISYLKETVLDTTAPDAQGLLYLACIYAYCQQFDEMMEVLERESQISSVMQDMKKESRQPQMISLFLDACGLDQAKIERLRVTLNIPRTTKASFCTYVEEFPLSAHQTDAPFIKWIAARKPDAQEKKGKCLISISPLYPSLEGTVHAFSFSPDRGQEDIVPADDRVSVEELYTKLNSSFTLFCPID